MAQKRRRGSGRAHRPKGGTKNQKQEKKVQREQEGTSRYAPIGARPEIIPAPLTSDEESLPGVQWLPRSFQDREATAQNGIISSCPRDALYGTMQTTRCIACKISKHWAMWVIVSVPS